MKLLDQYPDVSREIRDAFRWPTRICIIALAVLILVATWVTQGCSTHSIVTPSGINATSSAMLYCPQREALQIQDGNQTITWTSDESGVGATVQALGHDAAGVVRP